MGSCGLWTCNMQRHIGQPTGRFVSVDTPRSAPQTGTSLHGWLSHSMHKVDGASQRWCLVGQRAVQLSQQHLRRLLKDLGPLRHLAAAALCALHPEAAHPSPEQVVLVCVPQRS